MSSFPTEPMFHWIDCEICGLPETKMAALFTDYPDDYCTCGGICELEEEE